MKPPQRSIRAVFDTNNISKVTRDDIEGDLDVDYLETRALVHVLNFLLLSYVFSALGSALMHVYPTIRINDHDLVYANLTGPSILFISMFSVKLKLPLFIIATVFTLLSVSFQIILVNRFAHIIYYCSSYETCRGERIVYSCYGASQCLVLAIQVAMCLMMSVIMYRMMFSICGEDAKEAQRIKENISSLILGVRHHRHGETRALPSSSVHVSFHHKYAPSP